MRFVAVYVAIMVVVLISMATSTSAFLVPNSSVGTSSATASAARQGRQATSPSNLVALSAGFFGGGGGNGNPNNDNKTKQQTPGGEKISKERRAQLGINADEDEYDLYYALDQNTDPIITKVIAGSFILVMIALLVYAVVIPSLTVYDEGVCR